MNIFEFVRDKRNRYETKGIYRNGTRQYLQFEHIQRIDTEWEDQYYGEDAYDNVIGDFPYHNIHKYRTLLEARSTDYDTFSIENEPKNTSRQAIIASMIVNKALANHHDEIRFGKTLNDISLFYSKYGGVISEKNGERIEVPLWSNMVTDQADIMASPRIKRVYMSPSDIAKKEGVWDNIDDSLLTADEMRDQDIGTAGSPKNESMGDLIEVITIEGDVSLALYNWAQARKENKEYEPKKEENYKFVYARIICCGADWVTTKNGKKEEKGIVFYCELEKKPLQKYLARLPLAGRGLGESVPESLWEFQRMHNFTKTEEMRMLAVAGKKLYVTDDPDVLSNIFSKNVDHGMVLRVAEQKYLRELNQLPTGLPVYQSMRAEVQNEADRTASSFSANLGEPSKSGVPFRAQYLQSIQGSSQFAQHQEEIGFFIKEIVEDFTLEDALKKASKKDVIDSVFSKEELNLIDEILIKKEVSKKELLVLREERRPFTQQDFDTTVMETKKNLAFQGNRRSISEIQDFIKDAGKKVRIHVNDEARAKAILFESYANLIQALSPEDPRREALLDKIMQAVGVSSEELNAYANAREQVNPTGKINPEGVVDTSKPNIQQAIENL